VHGVRAEDHQTARRHLGEPLASLVEMRRVGEERSELRAIVVDDPDLRDLDAVVDSSRLSLSRKSPPL